MRSGGSCSRAVCESTSQHGARAGDTHPNVLGILLILTSLCPLSLSFLPKPLCVALLSRHGLSIVLTNTRCCCYCSPSTIPFFTPLALTRSSVNPSYKTHKILSKHLPNWFNFSSARLFLGLDLKPPSVDCISSCAPSTPYRLARYPSSAHISNNVLKDIDLLMRHPFLFTQ